MATVWSAFLPKVRVDVPGVSDPLAEQEIRDAAIDFCDRSFVYQVDHTAIDSVVGQGEYTYAPSSGLKVVRPETVWYNKKQLEPVTRDDLDRLYDYWPDQSGTPVYFVQEKLEKLILVPKPDAVLVSAIRLKVSVKPARAALDIDDALYEKYLEDIASGAKARLLVMTKKPWSDAQAAVFHKQIFDGAIARARLAAARGHGRARLRIRAHFM